MYVGYREHGIRRDAQDSGLRFGEKIRKDILKKEFFNVSIERLNLVVHRDNHEKPRANKDYEIMDRPERCSENASKAWWKPNLRLQFAFKEESI